MRTVKLMIALLCSFFLFSTVIGIDSRIIKASELQEITLDSEDLLQYETNDNNITTESVNNSDDNYLQENTEEINFLNDISTDYSNHDVMQTDEENFINNETSSGDEYLNADEGIGDADTSISNEDYKDSTAIDSDMDANVDGDFETDTSFDDEVYFNVFCINNVTEEVVAELGDSDIELNKAVSFDDIIHLDDDYDVTRENNNSELSYRLHSVGTFYYMDELDYSNKLVPEFYMNSDDFINTDIESRTITFTKLPDESVTIALFVLPNTSETLSVSIEDDNADVVPVQTQAQLLRPVATGILTDSIPFLFIGGFGFLGLLSKNINHRREEKWQQRSI